jgi:Ca2+-binding EF-hand superfamily protein
MSKRILLSVAALALGSSLALADDRPERPRIDANGDGSIDLAELQAVRPNATVEQFNAADKDGNGLLSREEIRGFARELRGPPVDANGDGAVSFEELQARRPNITQEQFTALDADGSGGLSRAELRSGMGREIFRRLDADSSGGISFVELAQRMPRMTQERFNTLDADGNGQLSQGELSRARPMHRGQRPGAGAGERRPPGAGGTRPPRPPRTGG